MLHSFMHNNFINKANLKTWKKWWPVIIGFTNYNIFDITHRMYRLKHISIPNQIRGHLQVKHRISQYQSNMTDIITIKQMYYLNKDNKVNIYSLRRPSHKVVGIPLRSQRNNKVAEMGDAGPNHAKHFTTTASPTT